MHIFIHICQMKTVVCLLDAEAIAKYFLKIILSSKASVSSEKCSYIFTLMYVKKC